MVPCCGGILINKGGDKVGRRYVMGTVLMRKGWVGVVLDGERVEE